MKNKLHCGINEIMKTDEQQIADAIKKLVLNGVEVSYEDVIKDPEGLIKSADAINEEEQNELKGRDALIADAIEILKIAGIIDDGTVANRIKNRESAIDHQVTSVVEKTTGLIDDNSAEAFIREIDDSVSGDIPWELDKQMAKEVMKSKQQIEKELETKIVSIVGQLNQTERIFAEHYAKHKNQSAAARAAGSTAKRLDMAGRQIMNNNAKVGEYIELLCQRSSIIAALEVTEVINNFRNIYEKAMEAENFKEANVASAKLAEICGAIGGRTQALDPVEKKIVEQKKDAEQEKAETKDQIAKLLENVSQ